MTQNKSTAQAPVQMLIPVFPVLAHYQSGTQAQNQHLTMNPEY